MRLDDATIRIVTLDNLAEGCFGSPTRNAWDLLSVETGIPFSQFFRAPAAYFADVDYYYQKEIEILNQLCKEGIVVKLDKSPFYALNET